MMEEKMSPRLSAKSQRDSIRSKHRSNYTTETRKLVNRPIKVQDKIIGCLQNHTFIKRVIGSKHRLRCPPAWAIDAEAFDKEIKPNATEFVVLDKETGLEYHCLVENFDRLKGELDRGFGRQYFLTLNHWEVRDNGNHQLSLWGGDNLG
jgi:hypothetical protein